MSTIWFKRTAFTYLPTTFMGMAVTILAIVFLIPVYTAIVANSQSVNDNLYHLFVCSTCTAFWWKWIAEKTS